MYIITAENDARPRGRGPRACRKTAGHNGGTRGRVGVRPPWPRPPPTARLGAVNDTGSWLLSSCLPVVRRPSRRRYVSCVTLRVRVGRLAESDRDDPKRHRVSEAEMRRVQLVRLGPPSAVFTATGMMQCHTTRGLSTRKTNRAITIIQ